MQVRVGEGSWQVLLESVRGLLVAYTHFFLIVDDWVFLGVKSWSLSLCFKSLSTSLFRSKAMLDKRWIAVEGLQNFSSFHVGCCLGGGRMKVLHRTRSLILHEDLLNLIETLIDSLDGLVEWFLPLWSRTNHSLLVGSGVISHWSFVRLMSMSRVASVVCLLVIALGTREQVLGGFSLLESSLLILVELSLSLKTTNIIELLVEGLWSIIALEHELRFLSLYSFQARIISSSLRMLNDCLYFWALVLFTWWLEVVIDYSSILLLQSTL